MKLSIVTTLYESASYIEEFYIRSKAVAKNSIFDSFEIIFVNDGSPDTSLEIAIDISLLDNSVTVVDLSRNFGHHKAMMTGLSQATGDYVFLIDSDLEEEPEWLIPFSLHLENQNADVIYGVQEERKGKWFERFSGQWFYKFFDFLTGLKLPANVVTARLMTKRYVNALLLHREREVFMAGLWLITGFSQKPYPIKKHNTSQTTYTLAKKISLLINSVTSFSNKPLVAIFNIGLSISVFSFLYIIYILYMWFNIDRPLSGWTSVIASVWLLGGMIISFIGVIGIYVSKIFSETKQRPYSIVRQIYKNNE